MKALIVAALAVAPAAAAFADVPIAQVRPTDGISISGEVASVFGNKFVLRDQSGEILVDTGPRWFRERSFAEGERLTVVGELDEDEFEAQRITREDGTVLTIRPDRGPPPWAGGRR